MFLHILNWFIVLKIFSCDFLIIALHNLWTSTINCEHLWSTLQHANIFGRILYINMGQITTICNFFKCMLASFIIFKLYANKTPWFSLNFRIVIAMFNGTWEIKDGQMRYIRKSTTRVMDKNEKKNLRKVIKEIVERVDMIRATSKIKTCQWDNFKYKSSRLS